jgi:hypothetical protein
MKFKCSLFVLVVILSAQLAQCMPNTFKSGQDSSNQNEVASDDKNNLAEVYAKADEQLLNEIVDAEWKKAMVARIVNKLSDLGLAQQLDLSSDSTDLTENELVNMNELLASQTDRVNKRMMVEKPKRMKNR